MPGGTENKKYRIFKKTCFECIGKSKKLQSSKSVHSILKNHRKAIVFDLNSKNEILTAGYRTQ